MARSSRRGIGKAVAAVIVVAMVLIVVGLGTVFGSQGPPVTLTQTATSSSQRSSSASQTSQSSSSSSSSQLSTVATAGCVFSSPQPIQATSTVAFSFTGCLTAGSSGSYPIAVLDHDQLTMSGMITSQYPIRITIAGAEVSNLSPTAGTIYLQNDTTSAALAGIYLLPQNGYAVTIRNEGGQNNTVTMNLQLNDVPGGGNA